MADAAVISKKLKFKGEKTKKKKRQHHHDSDGDEDLAAMAAADPRGWIFPSDVMEISGPSFIVLPSEPLTCLAWNPQRQQVYPAPLEVPEAPEGANDLSDAEILAAVEPTDVNHVWVISRLSGSEGVVTLRSSSGTFLTASPSGVLSAITPSRGPLESLVPTLSPSSTFPTLLLRTHSEKFISINASRTGLGSGKPELRADAEDDSPGIGLRIKCQREFVGKARLAMADAEGGGGKGKRRLEGGMVEGSLEDEARKNKEAQAWGAGRSIVSDKDRRDLKKARKDGRLAEAMLDRRAALKSDRYAK